MTVKSKKIGLFFVLAGFLQACGGTAQPVQDLDTLNLSTNAYEAIWHGELGASPLTPMVSNEIVAEDGVAHANTIHVPDPGDGSTYVHGVYSIDIPDNDDVRLISQVGFIANDVGQLRFRIYIQDEDRFPILAEVLSTGDGRLDWIEADVTPYRGQSRIVILAAIAEGESLSPVLWIDPTLLSP